MNSMATLSILSKPQLCYVSMVYADFPSCAVPKAHVVVSSSFQTSGSLHEYTYKPNHNPAQVWLETPNRTLARRWFPGHSPGQAGLR